MPEDIEDVVEETEVEPEVEETEDESEQESGEQQEDSESATEDEEEVEEETEEVEEEEEAEPDEQLPSKYHRPIFSEIKKEFPEFFKKFPDMREVYFRESKFSTIFPTVEDAEESFSKAQSFDVLAQDLVNGSAKTLLDELEKAGKERVVALAENFLPEVYGKSQELYYSIVSPLIGGFIKNLYAEGEKTNNDSMKAAAMYAAQFGWGHTDVEKLVDVKKTDPKLEEAKQRLEQERANIGQTQYKEAYNVVASRSQKLLVTEISKAVSSVKDDFKRNAAVREIFEKVNEVLTADTRHIRLMNSLWSKAQKQSFSPESRNRLVFTLLARAKQVMPAVSREIMAQITKPTEKKKIVKKSDAGGQATKKESSNSAVGKKPGGKVDWTKYKDGTDFLSAFVESKGRVERK